MGAVIEVEHLWKTFQLGNQEVEIIKDISFQINQGEFVSIMGPSGSGKSTLLYLLGSLDKPTKGSIKVNGMEISMMHDKQQSIMRRKDIGFVFQFYNLIPNLNVKENIMLPVLLDGKKLSAYKKNLDEILEIVGLTERKNHLPRELSGGQQQRVAIARALINEPNIILADEPIGNLDSKSGNEIMKLFQRINKEKGKTIIQVTHSLESANYGQRILYVKDGSIQNKEVNKESLNVI
ncbi:ABC transporter ATP-binding protein [Cellulosilyticum ruminicola]|uniref:ABC transporter ATP-binding protein n=1 Tax=Cellulosilyticum ruminicola TaxID=425254 RepID=UPI0006D11035|nr:ABC transporter ATP-binding protein [Cellulosilyticum ruminicola]